MKLGLTQNARMEQRLVQSPQMIQAMQILQLSTLDLEGRVEQELMENPFLEVAEGAPEAAGDEHMEHNPEERPENPGVEGMLEVLEHYERELGDGRRLPRADAEAGDRKLEAMNNTPARTLSLGDTLREHLTFLNLSERDREIAEYLIYSLDDRGYLTDTLENLATGFYKTAITADDLGDILTLLRAAA
ncbi:MAG: hypothetical protein OSB10_08655, partial [Planctomycetota bacterium]|nr:hypothetical protein [Planctomycetota bacterium]